MTEPPREEPPRAESKDPEVRLLDALDYRFENRTLLIEALTHRSYVNEVSDPEVRDNERFEFLGDAVIDLVVAERLMAQYPDAQEGRLTKLRASIVSEGALAGMARQVELGPALRLGRGEELSGGREKASILADAFEALIAAVYLDSGLDTAARVLLRRLEVPATDDLRRRDPKTELQHRIQADLRQTPTYHLLGESGPEHEKEFEVAVQVGEDVVGKGVGRTKKEAEQRAAAVALVDIERVLED